MRFLILLFPLICFAEQPEAIYGTNDLVQVTDLKSPKLIELSKSIAIRVSKSSRLKKLKKVSEGKLCRSVSYYKKKRIEKACTGFLVGKNKLMTSLHCLEGEGEGFESRLENGCKNFRWMFDYSSPKMKKTYACKKVLEYAGEFGVTNYFENDYVLIELEETDSRPILKISKKESPNEVFMMGHPMGLPLMVSQTGEVLESLGSFLFTNLDAFEGSSGSPVFNKETFEVVGILNSGRTDYFHNGKCVEFETYENSEGREAVFELRNLTFEIE